MEGRPRQAVTPLENGAVAVAGCTSLGLATVSFLLHDKTEVYLWAMHSKGLEFLVMMILIIFATSCVCRSRTVSFEELLFPNRAHIVAQFDQSTERAPGLIS